MRARGPRGTHGLVGMVREQVKVVAESTDRLEANFQSLNVKFRELAQDVEVISANVQSYGGDVRALGKMLEAVAEAVDAQGQVDMDHEERLRSIEKQLRGRRGR